MYRRVKDLLERDPFLAYLEETDDLYRVRNHADLILTIPKDRAVPERFPPRRPALIQSTYRRLVWATVGLILSGIGALVLAPLAAWRALQALGRPLSRADRARARIAFFLAALLFVLGLLLSSLFWLHLAG